MTDRRSLLAGFAAAAIAAPFGTALAAPRRTFFQRIGRPIGLQLYTLGDDPTKDLDGTLARVAQIGFRDIEVPGLLGRTPAALKTAMDKAGLAVSCLHLGIAPMAPANGLSLDSEPQRIADDLGALGVHQVVLPMVPIPANFQRGPDGDFRAALQRALSEVGTDYWKRLADLLNRKAQALKPYGITLGYHNHNVEFAAAGAGGGTGWDIIAGETDPALVFFEIDLGWVSAAGLDPVAFLRRHNGRVRWIHVKDVQATTKTNVALAMDPAEVGTGRLDWARILPAAHAAGVQHYYVEQEPPFTMPRIEAAAKSFAYLSRLRA